MAYENIISETRDAVGVITLNRPKALNALNAQLIAELNDRSIAARTSVRKCSRF